MIPIAEMGHGEGVHLAKGDKVYVLGYATERETPFAVVMHPIKGWHKVPFFKLIPKGWRTSL